MYLIMYGWPINNQTGPRRLDIWIHHPSHRLVDTARHTGQALQCVNLNLDIAKKMLSLRICAAAELNI